MTKLSELDAMLTFGADDILAATEDATGNSKSVTGTVLKTYMRDADLTAATDAATVSTVMKRDAAGRAKVVAPSVAADIALKSTVTADIATHDALATAHSAIMSTTTETAGGDFAGTDNLKLAKIGTIVVLQWYTLTFSSNSAPQSAPGAVPLAYRPVTALYGTNYSGNNFRQTPLVGTDGSLMISFRDHTGALTARTSAYAGFMVWLTA